MPCHTLEVVVEVTLEVILEHVLGIKTMTSLILDHVATAYLYLGINSLPAMGTHEQPLLN